MHAVASSSWYLQDVVEELATCPLSWLKGGASENRCKLLRQYSSTRHCDRVRRCAATEDF